jgi:periplasmic copper chaperone A
MTCSAVRRVLLVVGVGASMALILGVAADAHAELAPSSVKAGTTSMVMVVVGHGCSGSPTVRVRTEVPTGVTVTKPAGPKGWTGSVAGRVVTWSGPAVGAKTALRLTMTIAVPSVSSARELAWPTVQVCQTGQTRWTEMAVAGEDEPEYPAPLLTIRPTSRA